MGFLEDLDNLVLTEKELECRFTYHPPKPEQVKKYEGLRDVGKSFARLICDFCPPSPERHEAIKAVEQAVMWANAAIARRT